jgi:AcrR family transcriptional regulator
VSPRQASDEKAQQIARAARKILASKGAAKTTINEIAAEAGVSRGLLHYYFKNKEELLARIVRDDLQMSMKMIAKMFEKSRSADELAENLAGVLRLFAENALDGFFLFYESFALARQNPAAMVEFRSNYRMCRDAVRRELEKTVERGVIRPKVKLAGLAMLINGIIDGLGLQLVTEPELVKDEAVWESTRDSIRALLGP